MNSVEEKQGFVASKDNLKAISLAFSDDAGAPLLPVEDSKAEAEDLTVEPKIEVKTTDPEVSEVAESNPSEKLSVKLMDKMLSIALPPQSAAVAKRVQLQQGKAPFSMNIMGKNFRGVTSRFTILYETYYAILEVLTWNRPTFTLGVMAIYSFICLHPRLLFISPLAYIVLCVMVPAYASRHYVEHENCLTTQRPTMEPKLPSPAPEFSRDFYINLVDTQNAMTDFIRAYDAVSDVLANSIYFTGDESLSAAICFVCLVGIAIFYVCGDTILLMMPWKFFFFFLGWCAILLLNPMLHRIAVREYQKLPEDLRNKITPSTIKGLIEAVFKKEFLFHADDDLRIVEAFELQELNTRTRQWKTALFVGHPHIPSMLHEPQEQECDSSKDTQESRIHPQFRHINCVSDRTFSPPPKSLEEAVKSINDEVSMATHSVSTLQRVVPPQGVYSLEEIEPPLGWTFLQNSESPWKLDYIPEQWVMWWGAWRNFLEIDHDEKWVYDVLPDGLRGTWRRRRWVNTCKRKSYLKDDI